MTREQRIALALLGALFLLTVVVLTIRVVWGAGALDLDQLPH